MGARLFALGALSWLAGVTACAAVTGLDAPWSWPRGDFHQAPPERFRGDTWAIVRFTSHVDADCRAAGATPARPGWLITGCTNGDNMWLPSPYSVDPAQFGLIARHELGHRNGWPADHPD